MDKHTYKILTPQQSHTAQQFTPTQQSIHNTHTHQYEQLLTKAFGCEAEAATDTSALLVDGPGGLKNKAPNK